MPTQNQILDQRCRIRPRADQKGGSERSFVDDYVQRRSAMLRASFRDSRIFMKLQSFRFIPALLLQTTGTLEKRTPSLGAWQLVGLVPAALLFQARQS